MSEARGRMAPPPGAGHTGGRLASSLLTSPEGRAGLMMPDPNSLTSGTPTAPSDADLLYASAVRLLAYDRIAEIDGEPTHRVECLEFAARYGLTRQDAVALITCSREHARRAMVTGQVPR